MSEKELITDASLSHRGRRFLLAKPRMVVMLLLGLALMWVTPVGLKWLLVQQLQQTLKREVKVDALHIHPWSLSLSVDGLSVQNAEGAEFVGWQRLTVDVSA